MITVIFVVCIFIFVGGAFLFSVGKNGDVCQSSKTVVIYCNTIKLIYFILELAYLIFSFVNYQNAIKTASRLGEAMQETIKGLTVNFSVSCAVIIFVSMVIMFLLEAVKRNSINIFKLCNKSFDCNKEVDNVDVSKKEN